jgi:hypothetical protein
MINIIDYGKISEYASFTSSVICYSEMSSDFPLENKTKINKWRNDGEIFLRDKSIFFSSIVLVEFIEY